MTLSNKTVIGIDVGGCRKGFHGVALREGQLEARRFERVPELVSWCLVHDAQVIAIDAPCAWATQGSSRLAERRLRVGGETVQCFKTPARTRAMGRPFYEWVFHGEKLYQSLLLHYPLFDGTERRGKTVIETFPHAITCALAGRLIPARPKATTRRRLLREEGYDDQPLANIDFVDAALCALAAVRFLFGRTRSFGDREEGFIVIPD